MTDLVFANPYLTALGALVAGTTGGCVLAIVLPLLIGTSRIGAFVARWMALAVYLAGVAGLWFILSDGWLVGSRTGTAHRISPSTMPWLVIVVGFGLAVMVTRAISKAGRRPNSNASGANINSSRA